MADSNPCRMTSASTLPILAPSATELLDARWMWKDKAAYDLAAADRWSSMCGRVSPPLREREHLKAQLVVQQKCSNTNTVGVFKYSRSRRVGKRVRT